MEHAVKRIGPHKHRAQQQQMVGKAVKRIGPHTHRAQQQQMVGKSVIAHGGQHEAATYHELLSSHDPLVQEAHVETCAVPCTHTHTHTRSTAAAPQCCRAMQTCML